MASCCSWLVIPLAAPRTPPFPALRPPPLPSTRQHPMLPARVMDGFQGSLPVGSRAVGAVILPAQLRIAAVSAPVLPPPSSSPGHWPHIADVFYGPLGINPSFLGAPIRRPRRATPPFPPRGSALGFCPSCCSLAPSTALCTRSGPSGTVSRSFIAFDHFSRGVLAQ
jgi:hypothetical protein